MTTTHVVELVSASADETEALGARLGGTARAREILALVGDLGTGKTCLVRGVARGLGAGVDEVASPSFVLATEYRGGRLPLHHLDLYRLDAGRLEAREEDRLLIEEALEREGVVAVEWFDRLGCRDDQEILVVTLRHGGGDRRYLRFDARGSRHVHWLRDALAG